MRRFPLVRKPAPESLFNDERQFLISIGELILWTLSSERIDEESIHQSTGIQRETTKSPSFRQFVPFAPNQRPNSKSRSLSWNRALHDGDSEASLFSRGSAPFPVRPWVSRNSGFSLQKWPSSSLQAAVSVHSCSSTNWLGQGNAVGNSSEDCDDCGAEREFGQNRSEVLPFSATALPFFVTVSSNIERRTSGQAFPQKMQTFQSCPNIENVNLLGNLLLSKSIITIGILTDIG
jgi:hypothetical protein